MDKHTPDFDRQAKQIARPLRDRDDARKFARQLLETAYGNGSRPEIADEPGPLIGNPTGGETANDEPPFYPGPVPPKWVDILAIIPVRVTADDDPTHPAFISYEDREIAERVEMEVPRDRVSPGEEVALAVVRGDLASALHLLAYVRHCAERNEAGGPRCGWCSWSMLTGLPWPGLGCETGKALAARIRETLVIA